MASADDMLGALIRQWRQDQRVTQKQLAAAAGLSLAALRDLEQGRTCSPRWGTVQGLAAALCLDRVQRAELARAWQRDDAARRAGPGRLPKRARIAVLGPLAVWRGGEQLALGSGRQRAVLGLLSLHAGVDVHRDELVDVLWREKPPASAIAEVQGYVSRLRKLLGDGPARRADAELVTTAGGCCYRLNADAPRLDLVAFEALTRQAGEATALADPARACDRYERALGLWRGEILVDIDLLRNHPAAVERMRQRSEAVLGYAEAASDAGNSSRVLPYLRELCARERLNERAHAQLMIALAATGEQAAALDVFTDMRQRLDAELGITPSPVLSRAYTRVLRQETGPHVQA
jgi:DNA-binding SARP family transcriptional activator/DNA-binding XRE family transcriptional regulator